MQGLCEREVKNNNETLIIHGLSCLLAPEVTLPPPSQSTALTCVPKVAQKMPSGSQNSPASQRKHEVHQSSWDSRVILPIACLGLSYPSSGCRRHNPRSPPFSAGTLSPPQAARSPADPPKLLQLIGCSQCYAASA